jgi:hypothetical protein
MADSEPRAAADENALKNYMRHLARVEREGCPPIPLDIGPWTAMTVILGLQLAMDHPEVGGELRRTLEGFVNQLSVVFDGTPGEQIIRVRAEMPSDSSAGPHGSERG